MDFRVVSPRRIRQYKPHIPKRVVTGYNTNTKVPAFSASTPNAPTTMPVVTGFGRVTPTSTVLSTYLRDMEHGSKVGPVL